MMKRIHHKPNSNRPRIFVALAALIGISTIIGGLYFYTQKYQNSAKLSTQNDSSTRSAASPDNYNTPPTEEEKALGNEQKDNNNKREDIDSSNPSKNAIVNIVDAGQYNNVIEVRGYISNVYEDGGKCEVVFNKDGQTVTKSTTAFRDATTTQCGALDIARSEFSSSGIWSAYVEYVSTSAKGRSALTKVTIK